MISLIIKPLKEPFELQFVIRSAVKCHYLPLLNCTLGRITHSKIKALYLLLAICLMGVVKVTQIQELVRSGGIEYAVLSISIGIIHVPFLFIPRPHPSPTPPPPSRRIPLLQLEVRLDFLQLTALM